MVFAGLTNGEIADQTRDVVSDIVVAFESASSGGYAAYQAYDIAIVTYGKYQFTLRGSRSLQDVLESYTQKSHTETAKMLGYYLNTINGIKNGDITDMDLKSLKTDAFKQLLIQAASEDAMKEAQEEVFTQDYYEVAKTRAENDGVTSPLGIAIYTDTYLQSEGGLDVVQRAVAKSKDLSKTSTEPERLNIFLNERRAYLLDIARKDRAKGDENTAKMLENSAAQDGRVGILQKLVTAPNPDLDLKKGDANEQIALGNFKIYTIDSKYRLPAAPVAGATNAGTQWSAIPPAAVAGATNNKPSLKQPSGMLPEFVFAGTQPPAAVAGATIAGTQWSAIPPAAVAGATKSLSSKISESIVNDWEKTTKSLVDNSKKLSEWQKVGDYPELESKLGGDIGKVEVTPNPQSSLSPSNLAGVNFTSIRLNYISISMNNSSGGVNFDSIFKAQKTNGSNPGINVTRSMQIGINAFLTGLACPDNIFWVNLNPREPDRIIDSRLNQSEVGIIMLEADLQMKKDIANYGNPCVNETGKAIWHLLDKKYPDLVQHCMDKYPGEIKNINNVEFLPISRSWIVPDKIYAYSNGNEIYIINATLTIQREPQKSTFKLENQDIRSLSEGCIEELNRSANEFCNYTSALETSIIMPYVISDINHGKKYEDLRNVYTSLALAQWYKSKMTPDMDTIQESSSSSQSAILKQLGTGGPNEIWNEYMYSFKNGDYRCWENFTTHTATGVIKENHLRSQGGVNFAHIKDNLEIDKMPPEIVDRFNKTIKYGFTNEKEDVLFGNRLHIDLR